MWSNIHFTYTYLASGKAQHYKNIMLYRNITTHRPLNISQHDARRHQLNSAEMHNVVMTVRYRGCILCTDKCTEKQTNSKITLAVSELFNMCMTRQHTRITSLYCMIRWLYEKKKKATTLKQNKTGPRFLDAAWCFWPLGSDRLQTSWQTHSPDIITI